MKPAPFSYLAPATLDEALALMAEYGDEAKLLAGGQSLVPVMNFRLSQPGLVIDLNTTSGLDQMTLEADGSLSIGCMARHSAVEKSDLVRTHAPLIHETMPWIAHPQIRNRGTLGGSLAHADPAAELPVLMVALDAAFELQKQNGSRRVAAEAFYTDLFETELQSDEILTRAIIPPLPSRTGTAFQEIARRHGDYAMAGVAAIVTLDAAGVCQAAKLVYLNVGPIPTQAKAAAAMLIGQRPSETLIQQVAEHAATHEMDPSGDIHASAEYRRHLAKVLGKRALTLAFERTG